MLGDYLDVDPRNVHATSLVNTVTLNFQYGATLLGVQKLETILANNEQYKQEDLDKIFENVRDAAPYHRA